jgi:hypothetical protein
MLDELYGRLDAALEEAAIPEDEYSDIRKAMSINSLTKSQVEGLLFWLDLNAKWSEAQLAAPDMILQELREQLELDRYMRNGWTMSDESLLQIWNNLNTAVRVVARFKEEHGREPSFAEVKIAGAIGITSDREKQAAAKSNGGGGYKGKPKGSYTPAADAVCGACGSTNVWDNRRKKASGEFKAGAPDLKCKDCQEATWLDAEQPQQQQQAPAAAKGDGLPF